MRSDNSPSLTNALIEDELAQLLDDAQLLRRNSHYLTQGHCRGFTEKQNRIIARIKEIRHSLRAEWLTLNPDKTVVDFNDWLAPIWAQRVMGATGH